MSRFSRVRRWFAARTPLEPTLLEGPAFEDAIAARMRELNIADDVDFVRVLEDDPLERARAQAIVAVPETWLFRGGASFEFLRERLAERRDCSGSKLRMLSAGCANGAEPWSMAVAACAAGIPASAIVVDAVELNPDVLVSIDQGVFRGMAARDGAPAWAAGWVQRDGDAIAIAPELRGIVRAHRADLVAWEPPAPFAGYAAIFCRNLIIYLKREERARLMSRLAAWLAPDGFLCVGHADAAAELLPEFRPCGPAAAFSLERPVVQRAQLAKKPAKSSKRTPAAQRSVRAPRQSEPIHEHGNLADLLASGEERFAATRLADAEDCFRRVVYLDPTHEHALVRLAEIAERTHRHGIADRFRARALQAHLENEARTRRE